MYLRHRVMEIHGDMLFLVRCNVDVRYQYSSPTSNMMYNCVGRYTIHTCDPRRGQSELHQNRTIRTLILQTSVITLNP